MRNIRNFDEQVKKHMEEYKEKVLGITEKGVYVHKGELHKYGHILPKDKKWKNIIPYKAYDIRDYNIITESKLHKYFHHLNSSQAICLNFFYPLVIEKRLDLILNKLSIDGDVDYNNVKFEKESDVDNGYGRPTNFDFYIPTTDNKKIYFEIKYTESEFGKAKNDAEHQNKYNDLYKQLLYNNKAINNKYNDQDKFFENYQILRNLVHINQDSTVVFIYPEKNINIRKAAEKAKNKMIASNWQDHFISVTWEDIVQALESKITDKDLKEYYSIKFTEKYL